MSRLRLPVVVIPCYEEARKYYEAERLLVVTEGIDHDWQVSACHGSSVTDDTGVGGMQRFVGGPKTLCGL